MTDTELEDRFTKVTDQVSRLADLVTQVAGKVDGLGVRMDAIESNVRVIAEGHGAFLKHIVNLEQGIGRLESGQVRIGLRISSVESGFRS